MSETDNLELVPFGCLPFDLFIMERWDVSSPLSKNEQKKTLVTEWIQLGQQGRKVRRRSYKSSSPQTLPFSSEISELCRWLCDAISPHSGGDGVGLSHHQLYFSLKSPPTHPAIDVWSYFLAYDTSSTIADTGMETSMNRMIEFRPDLLTPSERAMSGGSYIYWVRTWYGTGTSRLSPGPAGGETTSVSRNSADVVYSRLWRQVFLAGSTDEDAECDGYSLIGKTCIFEDGADFGVIQHDQDEEVARAGELPPFVLAVLLKFPDYLDSLTPGFRDENEPEADEEVDRIQQLLVMVADREACEGGWILQVAINHKGKVLPKRVRSVASHTDIYIGQWVSGATPRDLGLEDEEIEAYVGVGEG